MNCIEEMLLNNEQLFRGKKVKNVRADVHRLEFEFEDGEGAIVQSDFWKDAPLGHGLLVFPHNVKGMPRGHETSAAENAGSSALASPSCSRRDLPDYVFSAYQSGCGDVRLVDNATKEVLSDKFDIIFADTNAGYFVGIFRKDLRNEHFLMPCDATLERFDKSSQTWQPHRPPSTDDVQ